jgi:capsid assembly protease
MDETNSASLPIPQGMPHLAARFTNTPLMIHAQKFDVIVRSLGPRLGFDAGALPKLSEEAPKQLAQRYSTAGADADYEVVNGIAIIPVQGTLLKKGSWMSAYSGCCSYLDIQGQMEAALSDAGVRGILLDIDSPGGEVSGCFELADFIYASRGVKPIYASANDCALSAAYAIASAAERIFVTRSGAVGSVGVYALHAEQSEFDKTIGVKYTYVFAGDKKVDGNPHEPLSKSAYADMKAEIDREYGVFTETVARNRKADVKAIVATGAGLLWADGAIPLFADAVGTVDDALAALMDATGQNSTAASAAIKRKGEVAMLEPKATAAVEDEMKKTEAEPDPDDPNEEDETPEEENKDEMKSKSQAPGAGMEAPLAGGTPLKAVRTVDDIKAISALCKLAGCPEKVAAYLEDNKSVAEVSEMLTAAKAEETEKTMISSRVDTTKGAAARIQDIEAEAVAYARQNKGVTKEQAFAQMLEANPEAYASYRAQHNAKGLLGQLEAAGVQFTVR